MEALTSRCGGICSLVCYRGVEASVQLSVVEMLRHLLSCMLWGCGGICYLVCFGDMEASVLFLLCRPRGICSPICCEDLKASVLLSVLLIFTCLLWIGKFVVISGLSLSICKYVVISGPSVVEMNKTNICCHISGLSIVDM